MDLEIIFVTVFILGKSNSYWRATNDWTELSAQLPTALSSATDPPPGTSPTALQPHGCSPWEEHLTHMFDMTLIVNNEKYNNKFT